MRRGLALLIPLVAIAAVGALAWGTLTGEVAERAPGDALGPMGYRAQYRALYPLHNETLGGCEICHYAWTTPASTSVTRDGDALALALRPVSGYELAAAFAAPETPGMNRTEAAAVEEIVPGQTTGSRGLAAANVPEGTGHVYAEVYPNVPDRRPAIQLSLVVGEKRVEGSGGPAFQHALLTLAAPAASGEHAVAEITLGDGAVPPVDLLVRFRFIPATYTAVRNATLGAPAEFNWSVPPTGNGSGSVHLLLIAFNDHSPEKWLLPIAHESALYEAEVQYGPGLVAEPPAPDWTAEAVEAAWAGKENIPLYEESRDGLRAYVRNERGEWKRQGFALAGNVPEEAPFPALPPGTTYVKATLTWQKRVALAPDPNWVFAYSARPVPDFLYPEPTSIREGERVDIVPITPDQWETTPTGWFQAFYLLGTDADGRAAFDGSSHYLLTAHRGPVPTGK